LYKVNFYRDRHGNEPVADYMRGLAAQGGKDARIKLNKIRDYVQLLRTFGKLAGEPYIKHLEDEIWELRPLRDRILFVAWHEDSFVLLHVFMKQTQKTPKREIEKAKKEFKDLAERGVEYE